ncbi:MAG: hypothetical protein MH825_11660 [Cyanobacteria bacterium]|nr:hypothetical protein [Cyanobacteriota bacterium]
MAGILLGHLGMAMDGAAIAAMGDFSRAHCLAICAFLVPANVLTTVAMLAMRIQGRPWGDRLPVALLAVLFAAVMVFHVGTWFAVGVVMAPTYILLTLGLVCLWINGRALLVTARSRSEISAAIGS